MMFTNACWDAYHVQVKITHEAISRIDALDTDEESKHFPLRHLQLVLSYLASDGLQGFGRALALLWGISKSACDEVAAVLKPVEENLRNAVVHCAHETVTFYGYTDARTTLLHFVEAQMGSPLTVEMQSRLLMTYHKLYGSESHGALFNSKTKLVNARRGWTRPRKRDKTVAVSAESASSEVQETGVEVPQVPAGSFSEEASSSSHPSSSSARWLDRLD